jgi:hypothetical protein
METPMPDEVGSNHNDLLALLRALPERQQEADHKLATDAHAAVKDAVHVTLLFIVELCRCLAAPSQPSSVPGAALSRLLAALDDRDKGIVDSVLQPKNKHGGNYLSLTAKQERLPLAVAMQLLMQARKREEAAKEVVRLLGNRRAIFKGHDGSPWRLVARWRDELREDLDFKRMINESVAEITALLDTHQETADGPGRMARIILNYYI